MPVAEFICYFLLGDGSQRLLPKEEIFNQSLYMFDIGQNDLAGAFYSKTEDQVIASIPTILSEFEDGVEVSFCTAAYDI